MSQNTSNIKIIDFSKGQNPQFGKLEEHIKFDTTPDYLYMFNDDVIKHYCHSTGESNSLVNINDVDNLIEALKYFKSRRHSDLIEC